MRDTRLIFYRDDIERINRVLEEYNKLSGAKCNILIDKEGHSVTRVGGPTSFNEDTLAALVAGSFAATREMAKLLGEEEFSLREFATGLGKFNSFELKNAAVASQLVDGNIFLGLSCGNELGEDLQDEVRKSMIGAYLSLSKHNKMFFNGDKQLKYSHTI